MIILFYKIVPMKVMIQIDKNKYIYLLIKIANHS